MDLIEGQNLLERTMIGTLVGLVLVLSIYTIRPIYLDLAWAIGLPGTIGLFMFVPLILRGDKDGKERK